MVFMYVFALFLFRIFLLLVVIGRILGSENQPKRGWLYPNTVEHSNEFKRRVAHKKGACKPSDGSVLGAGMLHLRELRVLR